jgi:peptide-methionine (S)-S-oxide reductase
MNIQEGIEVASFGRLFWCTEAVFLELEGVNSVISGYIGGKTIDPTYKEICGGETGHAEAIEITFDPEKFHLENFGNIFCHSRSYDNKSSGNDVGTYRSEIFLSQREKAARNYIDLMTKEDTFGSVL